MLGYGRGGPEVRDIEVEEVVVGISTLDDVNVIVLVICVKVAVDEVELAMTEPVLAADEPVLDGSTADDVKLDVNGL